MSSTVTRDGWPVWPLSTWLQSQPQSPGLLPAAAAYSWQYSRTDSFLTCTPAVSCPATTQWPDWRPTAPAIQSAPPRLGVHANQPPAGQPATCDGTDPQPAVRGEPATGTAVIVAAVPKPPACQPKLPQQAIRATGGIKHRGVLWDLPVGEGRTEAGWNLTGCVCPRGLQQNPGEKGRQINLNVLFSPALYIPDVYNLFFELKWIKPEFQKNTNMLF